MYVSLTNLVVEAGYDVPSDMTLNDLLVLCSQELFGIEVAPEEMAVLKDGKLLTSPRLTLEALGIRPDDVLLVRLINTASTTVRVEMVKTWFGRDTDKSRSVVNRLLNNKVNVLVTTLVCLRDRSQKWTVRNMLKEHIQSKLRFRNHTEVLGKVQNLGSSHTQSLQTTMGQINNNKLTELIKSIKVPPKTTSPLRENARRIYDLMKNPAQRAHTYFKARPLVDQYNKDPDDFEGFCKVYERIIDDEVKKARLMADPASAEGQRLIQEQIQMENINYSYAQLQLNLDPDRAHPKAHALEHMPEAYIPVHMLYIKMEINGHPVKAFVDSGAQVSILSEACAQRCELSYLIDKRFTGTARGVGGFQKFVGKIHSCQVKVENRYFPCNFDVMADREMDILLGLNILKRHQCNINLKSNMLEMGDGTKTRFLSEAEINSHLEDLAASGESEFIVDSGLLTQAMNLGFSEEEASAALKMTRNDLEAALQQLFSKADERLNAARGK